MQIRGFSRFAQRVPFRDTLFPSQKTKDLFSRLSSRAARRGRWLFPIDSAKVLLFSKLPKYLLFFFSFCVCFFCDKDGSAVQPLILIYI